MREHSARLVLIVGALTMLATSAPLDYELHDYTTVAGESLVHVRFSPDAAGDVMKVVFTYEGADSATITPQPGFPQAAYALVAGQSATYDVEALCADGCELDFTIASAPDDTTYVEAISQRAGDASFCFPDNREYDTSAIVEVRRVP